MSGFSAQVTSTTGKGRGKGAPRAKKPRKKALPPPPVGMMMDEDVPGMMAEPPLMPPMMPEPSVYDASEITDDFSGPDLEMFKNRKSKTPR